MISITMISILLMLVITGPITAYGGQTGSSHSDDSSQSYLDPSYSCSAMDHNGYLKCDGGKAYILIWDHTGYWWLRYPHCDNYCEYIQSRTGGTSSQGPQYDLDVSGCGSCGITE